MYAPEFDYYRAGSVSEATRRLHDAVALFESIEARYEHARTMLSLGTAHRAAGDDDCATRVCGAALEKAAAFGACLEETTPPGG